MLHSLAAATIEKTYSCNRPEKLSSRFLGQSISGDVYTTYSKMAKIFNTAEVLQGSAMLHGKKNRFFFSHGKNALSNEIHFHCSCHATWHPCKTSFVLMLIGPCCCLVLSGLHTAYSSLQTRVGKPKLVCVKKDYSKVVIITWASQRESSRLKMPFVTFFFFAFSHKSPSGP